MTDSIIWHAPDELLHRYAVAPESLRSATADSLEQHLVGCEECRGRVAAASDDDGWLADSWASVVDVIDRPRRTVGERLLGRLGVPPEIARLSTATRELQWATIAAVLVLAGGAVLQARQEGSISPFLAVAPLVPLLCTALCFAPFAEPAGEAAIAAPIAGFALVVRRALAVTVPSIVVTALASTLTGDAAHGWLWLLPGLALTTGSVAASTWVRASTAAGGAALGWAFAVGLTIRVDDSALVDSRMLAPSSQVGWLIVGALATTLVVVRRDRFSTVEVTW